MKSHPSGIRSEEFISRMNELRGNMINGDMVTGIAAALNVAGDNVFIGRVWDVLNHKAHLPSARPQWFTKLDVDAAIAQVKAKDGAAKRDSCDECGRCRNTGWFPVLGTCSYKAGVRGVSKTPGGMAFFPWQVHPQSDGHIYEVVHPCSCGRNGSYVKDWIDPIIKGWRKYFKPYLTTTTAGGEVVRVDAQAVNCCTRKMLEEAGQTDGEQYKRAVHIAHLPGVQYTDVEELVG